MIKIRQGTFETNSSSVHTLCIANKKVDMHDFEGMTLVVTTGEYGWNHEPLNDICSRASYLYTAQLYSLYCKYSTTNKKFKQGVSNIQNAWCSILSKYGIAVEFDSLHYDEYGFIDDCGIDHCDELADWVDSTINHEHSFLKYLFNDDSIIYISNDNVYWEKIEEETAEINAWLKNHDCSVFEKGN